MFIFSILIWQEDVNTFSTHPNVEGLHAGVKRAIVLTKFEKTIDCVDDDPDDFISGRFCINFRLIRLIEQKEFTKKIGDMTRD